MKKDKIKSYRWGIIAELAAIVFLKLKGYKILKRRYKTLVGEVDIVALKGKCLVAVEVKARRNYILIEEVLGNNQKRRIKRAMMFFVAANWRKYSKCNIRFDLMVISPYKLPVHLIGFWE